MMWFCVSMAMLESCRKRFSFRASNLECQFAEVHKPEVALIVSAGMKEVFEAEVE